jgi:hypothetical protein
MPPSIDRPTSRIKVGQRQRLRSSEPRVWELYTGWNRLRLARLFPSQGEKYRLPAPLSLKSPQHLDCYCRAVLLAGGAVVPEQVAHGSTFPSQENGPGSG